MRRRIGLPSATLRALLALALLATPVTQADAAASDPELSARAWVLIDAGDGAVLTAEDSRSSLAIASTTKLMTAYVARRSLRLGERVVAPGYAPTSSAESLLGLVEGERITARDLLYGLLLASGNDAAVALATASSGSVERFVAAMNRSARRLGLADTHYSNPIGLDEAGNYSSALDLVTLAAKLREDAVFRKIFDSPSATLESGAVERTVANRNDLVATTPFVDGVKTGYTIDAGNVLVSSGSRGAVHLIAAVLGEPTESQRDSDSLALLEYGFSRYRERQVVKRRERLATASVADQDSTLPIVAAEPIDVTLRKGQEIETEIAAPSRVDGPITANERLGRVVVTVDGKPRGQSALLAANGVATASLGERIDSALPGPPPLAWALLATLLGVGAILILHRLRSDS